LDVNEFSQWVQYRALRGSLFLGRRIEQGTAVIAAQVNGGNGGKAKLLDFMPHEKSAQSFDDDDELTPELFMQMFG